MLNSNLPGVCNNVVWRCSFIDCNYRIALIKKVEILRLKLVATVLAASSTYFNQKRIDKKYWTEATVVLVYINILSSRFDMFMANRVELLHTPTSVAKWRFVPITVSRASLSSRGLSLKISTSADFYFLFVLISIWHEQPKFLTELSHNDPEVKEIAQCCSEKFQKKLSHLFAHYSDHQAAMSDGFDAAFCKVHSMKKKDLQAVSLDGSCSRRIFCCLRNNSSNYKAFLSSQSLRPGFYDYKRNDEEISWP